MLHCPMLRNIKQLHGFLGLIGCYRCSIKKLGFHCSFYNRNSKKTPFVGIMMPKKCLKTFPPKRSHTQGLVLPLSDFKNHFLIQTDASDVGMGIVLHPISYFSKNFATAFEVLRPMLGSCML